MEPKLGDLRLTLPTNSGVVTYPAGASFGPRVMRDYEFVWIIEGDCEYRWGSQSAPCPAGSMVLCRPGETDFFRWDEHRRTQHAFFHFNVERFPQHWPKPTAWPWVQATNPTDVLQTSFRHILRWTHRGDEDLIRLSMAQMLSAFVLGQADTGEIPRPSLPEPVERAWAFIETSLDRDPATPIALDDLAEAAFVTREHLCRVFEQSLGKSPMQTVRLARLDRSLNLLTRSNYSIGQIAEMSGFASAFHFSRLFKEAFGQSPRGVRNAVRAGGTPPIARLLTRQ